MKVPQVPGTAWVALIVAVSAWLVQSFPDSPWVAGVVVVLGAAAKLIELYWPGKEDEVLYRISRRSLSKGYRFWLGG